jgi:hypothetical protein
MNFADALADEKSSVMGSSRRATAFGFVILGLR